MIYRLYKEEFYKLEDYLRDCYHAAYGIISPIRTCRLDSVVVLKSNFDCVVNYLRGEPVHHKANEEGYWLYILPVPPVIEEGEMPELKWRKITIYTIDEEHDASFISYEDAIELSREFLAGKERDFWGAWADAFEI